MILNKPNVKLTSLIIAIALIVLTISCEKDPETVTVTEIVYVDTCCVNENDTAVGTIELLIGDQFEGGIVFYVDESGEHGLICSANNVSNSIPWGCEGTSISGADGTTIGSGNQNSLDIEQGCSIDIDIHAAFMALSYGAGGFDDWYLPSRDELNEIYLHRLIIADSGDPFSGVYWSSSEINAENAWMLNFQNGGTTEAVPKSVGFSVRAVRSF